MPTEQEILKQLERMTILAVELLKKDGYYEPKKPWWKFWRK